jgi:GNAT superfamily N-acetyltransferase
MFGSTSLAARVERAEARLVGDCAATVAQRRPASGAFAIPLAGGFATFTGRGSPLNKVAGLGFGGAVDIGDLEAVEHAFEGRGVPVQVELSCLADPAIGALLTRRGYVLENVESVLGLRLPVEARPRLDGIDVRESPSDELSAWLDVVVTGFGSPDLVGVPSHDSFDRDVLERAVADMASTPGFVRYLASRDGGPAGGASLRVSEGIAQLCGAATLPAQRRKGVQGALLAARLEAAGRAGCDVAVVTTQPGSKSQENVQKHGFDLLYTRAILVRSF